MDAPTDQTALRGLGPRTFISYSFQDHENAKVVAHFLREQGFNVSMEDDTSLIGGRLAVEIQRRIAEAECLVQLFTEPSSCSHWVREELRIAEGLKQHYEQTETKTNYSSCHLIIVPVVLSSEGAEEAYEDMAFIDARSDGLSPRVLEAIKKVCPNSVRKIEIDEALPHQLLAQDLDGHFAAQNLKKRVIVDANGFWFRVLDGDIEQARAMHTDPNAERLVAQEQEHRRILAWILEIADVCVESLFLCVSLQASKGLVKPHELVLTLQLFYKILFFKHFLEPLTMALRAGTWAAEPQTVAEVRHLNGLGNMMLQTTQDAATDWAFRQVLDPMELQSYSPSTRPLVAMRLSPTRMKRMLSKDRFSSRFLMPSLVEPYLLGEEALPHPTVKEWAWTLFGLPQAAVHGLEVGAPYQGEGRQTMYAAVNSGVCWFLDHFESIERESY